MASTPSWMMVVSPGKGEFQRAENMDGEPMLPRGAAIGAVENLRESIEVHTEHGGRLIEWLVDSGDLVSPGQPLVRLYPTTEASE